MPMLIDQYWLYDRQIIGTLQTFGELTLSHTVVRLLHWTFPPQFISPCPIQIDKIIMMRNGLVSRRREVVCVRMKTILKIHKDESCSKWRAKEKERQTNRRRKKLIACRTFEFIQLTFFDGNFYRLIQFHFLLSIACDFRCLNPIDCMGWICHHFSIWLNCIEFDSHVIWY